MEIELGSFPKFEKIRSNAYWSKVSIDSSLPVGKGAEMYKAHMRDCRAYPTVGMLAHRKFITGTPMNYPGCAARNIKFMEKQPEVMVLQREIKDKLKKLYPKTKHIREYIINNDRVQLDSIEPVRKYTKFDKLVILLKKFI